MLLSRFYGVDYLNVLSDQISKCKPFILALKTVELFYKFTNQLEKLKNLVRDNPELQ
jgi:hypothetical protein